MRFRLPELHPNVGDTITVLCGTGEPEHPDDVALYITQSIIGAGFGPIGHYWQTHLAMKALDQARYGTNHGMPYEKKARLVGAAVISAGVLAVGALVMRRRGSA
jgi:hypothetical protein